MSSTRAKWLLLLASLTGLVLGGLFTHTSPQPAEPVQPPASWQAAPPPTGNVTQPWGSDEVAVDFVATDVFVYQLTAGGALFASNYTTGVPNRDLVAHYLDPSPEHPYVTGCAKFTAVAGDPMQVSRTGGSPHVFVKLIRQSDERLYAVAADGKVYDTHVDAPP